MMITLMKPIVEYANFPPKLLEPLRFRKYEACRSEQKKCEMLAAGAVLREALRLAGYPVEGPLELTYLCYGKPYLADGSFYFSLSHSGDYVVCVVSDHEVGVDLEQLKPVNLRIADKILNDVESKVFLQLSEEQRPEELIRLWTRKEAVAKCLGGGIFRDVKELPMDDFVITTEKIDGYYLSIATGK